MADYLRTTIQRISNIWSQKTSQELVDPKIVCGPSSCICLCCCSHQVFVSQCPLFHYIISKANLWEDDELRFRLCQVWVKPFWILWWHIVVWEFINSGSYSYSHMAWLFRDIQVRALRRSYAAIVASLQPKTMKLKFWRGYNKKQRRHPLLPLHYLSYRPLKSFQRRSVQWTWYCCWRIVDEMTYALQSRSHVSVLSLLQCAGAGSQCLDV